MLDRDLINGMGKELTTYTPHPAHPTLSVSHMVAQPQEGTL